MISRRSTQHKFGPFKWESYCGSMSRGDSWRSTKEKLQPSRQQCGSSVLGLKVAPRPRPSFISSSTANGQNRLQESKSTKNCIGMIEWKAVREAARQRGFTPNTRQQQHGNIETFRTSNKMDFRR